MFYIGITIISICSSCTYRSGVSHYEEQELEVTVPHVKFSTVFRPILAFRVEVKNTTDREIKTYVAHRLYGSDALLCQEFDYEVIEGEMQFHFTEVDRNREKFRKLIAPQEALLLHNNVTVKKAKKGNVTIRIRSKFDKRISATFNVKVRHDFLATQEMLKLGILSDE